MTEKIIDVSNLEKALETLQRSMLTLEDNKQCYFVDMLEDSCIKRFEYTLETSWKLMKRVLKSVYGKSDAELTINNIFRFMQGYGFITNWENWRTYYEQRNNTAHEYNLMKAHALVKIIPQFMCDVVELLQNLKDELEC